MKILRPLSYFIVAFIYIPMIVLMVFSFNQSRINAAWSGFTLDWYRSLLENRFVLDALSNSMLVASATTVIATIMGAFAAYGFYKYQFRWHSLWRGFIYAPLIIPELLMGLSLLILFSQFDIPLGKGTLIIAHVTFSIPFVFLIIYDRLIEMGKELEEAAMDLGASPMQTFFLITLPVLMPSIFASILLVFTLSLDDFIISFFVAGPNSTTLPIYIYGMIKRGISPEINALATLMIIFTIVFIAIAEWIRRKGSMKVNKTS
ncbi:spermidine/putrescine ABC transporter permease [Desulfuribacillus stibiiarsenatis]|uniref:Spermidine/putrescine ABC transporter permease n=1 Tax=Desulfuribacillus stibiiarsenatis TaxID=1390249 RepID=A0A1E5L5E1_9FIRM|nr:ABC transporter permease [Desulfuribacillus stibiiarsenatis]OEH85284.1 spermidine/putrescine ABC transporter permease [Desulfuribacillus stibiiarsenatis]